MHVYARSFKIINSNLKPKKIIIIIIIIYWERYSLILKKYSL